MHRSTAPRTTHRLTCMSSVSLAALILATTLVLGCDRQDSAPPEAAPPTDAADAIADGPNEAAIAGDAASPGPILDCVAKDNARPICKFQSPEDIVPLPGNEALLISGYGALDASGAQRTAGWARALLPRRRDADDDLLGRQ